MCTEDSPSGLWRTLGKRVGCKPSGVRIPHPPPLAPEPIEVPGLLLLVAPPDLRPPRVLPAREPSAPRASLGASSRSPARPRRPRGGLQSGGACGLKDKTCWFCSDFSACWCGKIGIEVGWSQLEGWTKRVGFVATFRLAGAGKSTLKVVVSSWGYEYPQMSGVRASDDQVWALSVRGAAMALLPV